MFGNFKVPRHTRIEFPKAVPDADDMKPRQRELGESEELFGFRKK